MSAAREARPDRLPWPQAALVIAAASAASWALVGIVALLMAGMIR